MAISKDIKGEGIVSMIAANGAMPLISGNKKMLPLLVDCARKIAKESGQIIRICKFTSKEVIEEINFHN